MCLGLCYFFFQAEDGIRDLVRSRGLGDVYKRQTLWWRVLGQTQRNLTLGVQLPDPSGAVISERHRFPGAGNFATSLWRPGDTFQEIVWLTLPVSMTVPTRGTINVTLSDIGGSLPVQDGQGTVVGDALQFRRIPLPAPPVTKRPPAPGRTPVQEPARRPPPRRPALRRLWERLPCPAQWQGQLHRRQVHRHLRCGLHPMRFALHRHQDRPESLRRVRRGSPTSLPPTRPRGAGGRLPPPWLAERGEVVDAGRDGDR